MNQLCPPLSHADAAAMMAAAHARMRSAAAALSACNDSAFASKLQAFVAAAESDFHAEEDIMESIDYPGLPAHREEHARLLGALHHIDAVVDCGDVTAGREALALLPHWCCMHEAGMDQALLFALARSTD